MRLPKMRITDVLRVSTVVILPSNASCKVSPYSTPQQRSEPALSATALAFTKVVV